MAVVKESKAQHQSKVVSKGKNKNPQPSSSSSSSWSQIKNLLTCKLVPDSKIHQPSPISCCSFRDIRVEPRSTTRLGGGMHLTNLSGCYECRAGVDTTRYPLPRATICACPQCGKVFPKMESLEHHQAIKHAVSELGHEDSSHNIVEIIFKSSWMKTDNPFCKIERILKVQPTHRNIQRFEDYREAVKTRGGKTNARCAADGNELLRFHAASLTCGLGARGSTSLCGSMPGCGVCTIIRHEFQGSKTSGIRTTGSSGRAHDCLAGSDNTRRAMLVCRVIAGRVKRVGEGEEGSSYDSVASYEGLYSNMEEMCVFTSRAVLPCFVVIYKAIQT